MHPLQFVNVSIFLEVCLSPALAVVCIQSAAILGYLQSKIMVINKGEEGLSRCYLKTNILSFSNAKLKGGGPVFFKNTMHHPSPK